MQFWPKHIVNKIIKIHTYGPNCHMRSQIYAQLVYFICNICLCDGFPLFHTLLYSYNSRSIMQSKHFMFITYTHNYDYNWSIITNHICMQDGDTSGNWHYILLFMPNAWSQHRCCLHSLMKNCFFFSSSQLHTNNFIDAITWLISNEAFNGNFFSNIMMRI